MNVHLRKRRGRPSRGTREAILDAALALFSARGFHGTAVPEVARAAGIAAGSIYRHFTSKEALVNELFRRTKTALMTRLLDAFPFDAPPREQFRAFWHRLAAFAKAEPRAFSFLELHHHATYLDAPSRELELRTLAPIASALAATSAAGVTKPLPPAALMSIVWGAFVGLIKAAELGAVALTPELIADTEQACWDAIKI